MWRTAGGAACWTLTCRARARCGLHARCCLLLWWLLLLPRGEPLHAQQASCLCMLPGAVATEQTEQPAAACLPVNCRCARRRSRPSLCSSRRPRWRSWSTGCVAAPQVRCRCAAAVLRRAGSLARHAWSKLPPRQDAVRRWVAAAYSWEQIMAPAGARRRQPSRAPSSTGPASSWLASSWLAFPSLCRRL